MRKLQLLYADKETLEEVRAYFIQYLEAEGLRRLFGFEKVDGLAEARKIFEEAFENLDTLFAPKNLKELKVDNQAR